MLTTNQMILKTISTKANKEPKYKAILEDMGLKVYKSNWSVYNNWAVGCPATGKSVCLSKGRDNKKRLYDGYSPIHHVRDFEKVDLLSFLKSPYRPYYKKGIQSEYRELRYSIQNAKRSIKDEEESISDLQKKIDTLNDEMESKKEYLHKAKEDLRKARERVAGLKRK